MLGLAFLWSLAIADAAQAAGPKHYEVGQVWAYKARPEDVGSVLRIQMIEHDPAFAKSGPIYHISVIGVHFRNAPLSGDLPHLPVSRATLDASVTRLSPSSGKFPAAEPGIAEWRSARGGVFTLPLADIIGSVEQMFEKGP